ncbi:L-ascorbate metabolism protein UlaG, beta-lactamase superfamily [Klenkia marina]|uniref:L-ascorbate metabolism protein UlaG, beta-lactamase superfamily n=1 Tax=Klenkia marina TaxID=1960309 RepID=A0A1G4YLE7_9ACTN|nr:MBL fold metallo-hydrolase [Klenkia marina]SCX54291.1 L-ascorbate metabolism protein UlaG, beta-lactamase superfamily [Klenkia marina]
MRTRPTHHPARRLAAALLAAGAAVPVGFLARATWGLPAAVGAGRRRPVPGVAGSGQYRDGAFRNRLPGPVIAPVSAWGGLQRQLHRERDRGRPLGPVPLARPQLPAVAAELAVTWLGHSTVLLEVEGRRVLVDPVWGDRVSPSPLFGPVRLHEPPLPLADLAPVDAVLVSHDHYDHLDLPTVRGLLASTTAPFVVPLGVGQHLRGWGVPEHRVVELDWDGTTTVAGLTLVCTEARHFSGRWFGRDNTLWSSWVVRGQRRAVFFGGDSGYTPAFADIGRTWGPFDLTVLPIGAYDPAWPAVHMTPEEAVRVHGELGGDVLLPVHWATFNLAFHPWAEPVRRLLAETTRTGTRVVVPRPGGRVDALDPPGVEDWWTAVGSADHPLDG